MDPISIGLQLGRYVIRARLGAGGMAEVYLADDMQLGRRVALKFLLPGTESDARAGRRLLREARAAATLDHPHICLVHEVGEAGGRTFIAMQYVDGEALDVRMRRAPLNLDETLAIAVQVVDALSEAHAHGILHRDIKPANVMVSSRGQAKVMDFGLARLTDTEQGEAARAETVSLVSARGEIVGTAPYMSPEQARGEPLDARSDLFSTGVLLYEMVSGQRPFQGTSTAAVAAAILTQEPMPLARFAPDTPPELERIVSKALRKDRDSRYQTAKDLLIDLRTLKEERDLQLKLGRTPPPRDRSGTSEPSVAAPSGQVSQASAELSARALTRRSRLSLTAVAATVVLVAGAWFAWRAANERWARAQLPRITALAEEGDHFGAYDLALEVEPYLRGDTALAGVMPLISETVSVTTTPDGAAVYLTRFVPGSTTPPLRQLLGNTPVTNARVARGEYILSIEKEGFAPIEQTVSAKRVTVGTFAMSLPPIRIEQPLLAASAQPPAMVFVPGGEYRLASWSRPTDRRVQLTDYFIDKYEVSNREYKEFISAGGYVKRDFWKHAFVKDGRPVSWDEAMRTFADRTGLPGPRSWSNQNFPDGKGDHPVSDVTWYEAAAFAAFRGKQLPTTFQWEKAARNGLVGPAGISVMPWGLFYPGEPVGGRANFGGATEPTTSAEFGMSPFGAYHMAGNVAEWTSNDSSEGYLAGGGAWGDPIYTFGQFGGRPAFFSSPKLGFRCAQNATADAGDQGGARIEIAQEVPQYTASSPQTFAALAASYRYEETALDARVEDVRDTAEWRRETITFNAANGQRTTAYLYLPNHVPRPLQLLHFVAAGDVDEGYRSLSEAMDDYPITVNLRLGRAVFAVVLDGYLERRRPGFARPPANTAEFADWIVGRITDLRRGLDYLETRTDIDRTRMALLGPSAGGRLGIILGALESRYRGMVFVGAGLPGAYQTIAAIANPINFTPHIRAPKLVVQGRHDEIVALRTASEPFFKLLPEPKRLTLYDGGHMPTLDVLLSTTSGWLDEQLGRVTR